MFNCLFVANRGEIAVRIIRACRELGIKSMMPFHPVDRGSLAVRLADEAYPVTDKGPRELFLDPAFLIKLAKSHGAEALHPGYGFLSENLLLSSLCEEEGLVFIGPPSSAQKMLGDKNGARKIMASSGIPVVPGTDCPCASLDEAMVAARNLGYPVLLKAARGGGGRGMRRVESEGGLPDAFLSASREAKMAFGDGRIYIEKYLEQPRHVEIQIMGDTHGNIVSLGERECSIQRRYQKLIEEAPSPIVDEDMRKKMGEAAIKGAYAVGYHGAGTVEFLVDKNKNFYFLELNARIQVEHPVTELVTGIDIVKEQIKVAYGKALSFKQEEVHLKGWAIECRINCEDPVNNFIPSPGKLAFLEWPAGPGIRIETGILPGYTIPSQYDSLIAKIISWGQTREEARIRMIRAISECRIEGIPTTIPLHLAVLNHPDFIKGSFSTHFLEEENILKSINILKETNVLEETNKLCHLAALLAALKSGETKDNVFLASPREDGWTKTGGWQMAAHLESIGCPQRKRWL